MRTSGVRIPCIILPVLLALLAACGDPAGPEPDPTPPTPSFLTGCFSGDSTKSSEVFTPVISLAVPKGSCQATLLWTRCPDGDFLRYDLCRSGSPGFTESAAEVEVIASFGGVTDTVFTDTDPEWGDSFYYALLTVNAGESTSWSNEVELTMPGDLPDPSLLGGWLDCGIANLMWTPCKAYDFESYRLYRADSPGIAGDTASAVLLQSITGRFDTTYTDSLLLPSDEGYWYAVLTETTKGFHRWSNEFGVFVEEPKPYPCRIVYEIPLESYPTDLAVTGTGDHVICSHMGYSAEVVSMETFSASMLEGSPSARYVHVNPEADVAYLSPFEGDVLIEMDIGPEGGQRSCQLSGQPGECCTDPTGGILYVPFLDDHVIWIIDSASLSVVDVVYTDNPVRSLAYRPSGGEVYALSYIDDMVTILTTDPPEVAAEIPLGHLPVDMAFTPDGEELYVSCLGSDEIWLISCREQRVLDVIDMNNPTDIAVHPSGDYLYVIQTEGTIGIYSIPGHVLVHTINPAGVVTNLEALPSGLHMLIDRTTALDSHLVVLGR